jgi:hypothetical protein
MTEHFDVGPLVVIVITFILFLLALFTKGFTHDLQGISRFCKIDSDGI